MDIPHMVKAAFTHPSIADLANEMGDGWGFAAFTHSSVFSTVLRTLFFLLEATGESNQPKALRVPRNGPFSHAKAKPG